MAQVAPCSRCHTHEVIAAEVSLVLISDNEVLPTLLNPLRRKIMQISADGAYDTKGCYQLLRRKGCKATIPPYSNVGLWEKGHPRNEAVDALKRVSWYNGKSITAITSAL